MKELEKLASEACRDPSVQISDSLYQDGFSDGFEAGFRKAREMAIDVWEHNDHVYCDFYGGGRKLLENIGESEVE